MTWRCLHTFVTQCVILILSPFCIEKNIENRFKLLTSVFSFFLAATELKAWTLVLYGTATHPQSSKGQSPVEARPQAGNPATGGLSSAPCPCSAITLLLTALLSLVAVCNVWQPPPFKPRPHPRAISPTFRLHPCSGCHGKQPCEVHCHGNAGLPGCWVIIPVCLWQQLHGY